MCLYSKTIWITLIGFTDIKKKKKQFLMSVYFKRTKYTSARQNMIYAKWVNA